jgi:hypothetical protein
VPPKNRLGSARLSQLLTRYWQHQWLAGATDNRSPDSVGRVLRFVAVGVVDGYSAVIAAFFVSSRWFHFSLFFALAIFLFFVCGILHFSCLHDYFYLAFKM